MYFALFQSISRQQLIRQSYPSQSRLKTRMRFVCQSATFAYPLAQLLSPIYLLNTVSLLFVLPPGVANDRTVHRRDNGFNK